MSLFQLILFGALCVLIFPALLGLVASVVCKFLFKTRDGVAIAVALIAGIGTFITGIVFIVQAIARVAS
jgi:hypothetical protein